MKHYCEINESGFKFHFDSCRCFPGTFWKIKYQNGVFWAHIEVLINLQMDISITENLYEKGVSHYMYIDYFDFFPKILLHLNLIGHNIHKCASLLIKVF